ncbi:MAG: hypothetical protein EOO41_01530 [Methanobacteriota archaeon]|nr:MAG: hypothetical protein EOO41_01530 [Euryarchaeota archaeon]
MRKAYEEMLLAPRGVPSQIVLPHFMAEGASAEEGMQDADTPPVILLAHNARADSTDDEAVTALPAAFQDVCRSGGVLCHIAANLEDATSRVQALQEVTRQLMAHTSAAMLGRMAAEIISNSVARDGASGHAAPTSAECGAKADDTDAAAVRRRANMAPAGDSGTSDAAAHEAPQPLVRTAALRAHGRHCVIPSAAVEVVRTAGAADVQRSVWTPGGAFRRMGSDTK